MFIYHHSNPAVHCLIAVKHNCLLVIMLKGPANELFMILTVTLTGGVKIQN